MRANSYEKVGKFDKRTRIVRCASTNCIKLGVLPTFTARGGPPHGRPLCKSAGSFLSGSASGASGAVSRQFVSCGQCDRATSSRHSAAVVTKTSPCRSVRRRRVTLRPPTELADRSSTGSQSTAVHACTRIYTRSI